MKKRIYNGTAVAHIQKLTDITDEELITLIDGTESMNEDEKKYWKEVLPVMGETIKIKIWNILNTEKIKLSRLEEQTIYFLKNKYV